MAITPITQTNMLDLGVWCNYDDIEDNQTKGEKLSLVNYESFELLCGSAFFYVIVWGFLIVCVRGSIVRSLSVECCVSTLLVLLFHVELA